MWCSGRITVHGNYLPSILLKTVDFQIDGTRSMDSYQFDLLASRHLDINDSQKDSRHHDKIESMLNWAKLEPSGCCPAAREGHSSSTFDTSMYIFGGTESSKRTNDLFELDMIKKHWSIVSTQGSKPSPRSYHAASVYKNLMIVHGGEASVEYLPRKGHSTKDFGIYGSGICPGDSVASRLRPNQRITNQASTNSLENAVSSGSKTSTLTTCLEDMFALDMKSKEWKMLSTVLGPLPRKGHSITLVPLQGKPHFLLFGGYSKDNDTYSNSIHVCSAEDVVDCFRSLPSMTGSETFKPTVSLEALSKSNAFTYPLRNDFPETDSNVKLPVITWRTLVTNGKAPRGRYLHTATLVTVSAIERYLIIFGGLGPGQRPLSDLHILELESLRWIEPMHGTDALEQFVGGNGPPLPGLFGHVAFAIRGDDRTSFDKRVLVFGGTCNTNSSSGSNHSVFSFDLDSQLWSKVSVGHQFPPQRFGHSVAIMRGLTTNYEKVDVNGRRPLTESSIMTTVNTVDGGDVEKYCAVVFGGHNESMLLHDTWILDLQWRPMSMEQFNGNTEEKVRLASEELNNHDEIPSGRGKSFVSTLHGTVTTHKVGAVEESSRRFSKFKSAKGLLSLSASTPHLETLSHSELKSPHRSMKAPNDPSSSHPLNDSLLTELMQIKRERAYADVELKKERQKLRDAEDLINSLHQEIDRLKSDMSSMLSDKDKEVIALRQEIEASKRREMKLKQLNEEAFELLLLHDINRRET